MLVSLRRISHPQNTHATSFKSIPPNACTQKRHHTTLVELPRKPHNRTPLPSKYPSTPHLSSPYISPSSPSQTSHQFPPTSPKNQPSSALTYPPGLPTPSSHSPHPASPIARTTPPQSPTCDLYNLPPKTQSCSQSPQRPLRHEMSLA